MSAFDSSAFDAAAFDALAPGTSVGAASLPLVIMTGEISSAVLPMALTVAEKQRANLPLDLRVVPASILSGAESICDGAWTCSISLNGVDVTDRVIGDIRVEAEESAARIAEFVFRPPSGAPFALAGWTGLSVVIDAIKIVSGVAVHSGPLFTGIVDTPTVDMAAGTVSLRCTDDLQGRCEALSNAELLSLIGGYESSAVFDSAAVGWDYAEDRLSTVQSALDVSPSGQLRVTPWRAKVVADLSFDDDSIADGSIGVTLAERSSLVNEVNISFDYRFPRVKSEGYPVNFTLVDMTGFAEFVLADKWFMQRDQVVSAIEASGGSVETITYTPLPDEVIPVGSGYFTPSANDAALCMGFAAVASFDYTQTIEENHTLRVFNAKSIGAVGYRRTTLSGALEGEYPDLVATESAITLYKADVIANPPADRAAVMPGKTVSADVTLSSETNRAAANQAMETLIAIAKNKIAASHRLNRVTATVLLNPAIDVDKTVALSGSRVTAHGKVVSVTHTMSPETGAALSTFSVALSSIVGFGVVHDEDDTEASSGTTASSTTLSGVPVVTFNAGPDDDHVITVTFPAVESAERENATVAIGKEIAAAIVEDEFTITF